MPRPRLTVFVAERWTRNVRALDLTADFAVLAERVALAGVSASGLTVRNLVERFDTEFNTDS